MSLDLEHVVLLVLLLREGDLRTITFVESIISIRNKYNTICHANFHAFLIDSHDVHASIYVELLSIMIYHAN